MSYFLIALLSIILIGTLVFHAYESRQWAAERIDWREERTVLMQGIMAKSLPEYQAVSRPPVERSFQEMVDEDFAVGM